MPKLNTITKQKGRKRKGKEKYLSILLIVQLPFS